MTGAAPLLGPHPSTSWYLEAFRALRAAVQALRPEGPMGSLLVTSAQPGEGKSTVASNLATVLALSEKRTLLVDADFPLPQLHLLFGLKQAPGLTDVCLGEVAAADAIVSTATPLLSLLPVGARADAGADLSGSVRLAQVFADLKRDWDAVVIDTAPVNAFAGTLQLAAFADQVLFVVRSRSHTGQVQRALKALESVGARVPGIVLNDVLAADLEHGPRYANYYNPVRAPGASGPDS